jgi:hypothetical protein
LKSMHGGLVTRWHGIRGVGICFAVEWASVVWEGYPDGA